MTTPTHPAATPRDPAGADGWQLLLSGEGGDVLDLQRAAEGEIIAVTRLGLFASRDDGGRWTKIDAPPLVRTLHRAAAWWLGTDIGLFRRGQPDEPWQPVIPGAAVNDVLVDEQDGLVLSVTLDDGLLRSEDDGHTWEDANPGLPGDDIVAVLRSPAFEQDRTLFVATESGVFRSRNGGRAWRHVGLEAADIQCFAVGAGQLLAGTGDDGLWRSADAGRTWEQSLPGTSIIGFGASTDREALVLSDARLVTLDAIGEEQMAADLPPDALCAIDTGTHLLVGTVGHGVFRRDGEGADWVSASSGLDATARNRVRIVGSSCLVTTSGAGEMLASTDSGVSWREIAGAPLGPVIDFDARVGGGDRLEIVACDGQAAAVHDGDWRQMDAEGAIAVAWLGGEPAALTDDGQFIRGTHRARITPEQVGLIGARLTPVREHSGKLWVVLYTDSAGVVVLRSADDGDGWEPVLQAAEPGTVALSITDDGPGGEMPLLAVGNQVYRPLESREPVWSGEPELVISAMAADDRGGTLLATSHGLFHAAPGFTAVEPVPASPAPLLDVGRDAVGGVIVVALGGTVWLYAGDLAATRA